MRIFKGFDWDPNTIPHDEGELITMPHDEQGKPTTIPHDVGKPATMPHDKGEPTTIPHDVGESTTMPHDKGESTTMPHDEGKPTTMLQDKGKPTTMPNDDGEPTTMTNNEGKPTTMLHDMGKPTMMPNYKGKPTMMPHNKGKPTTMPHDEGKPTMMTHNAGETICDGNVFGVSPPDEIQGYAGGPAQNLLSSNMAVNGEVFVTVRDAVLMVCVLDYSWPSNNVKNNQPQPSTNSFIGKFGSADENVSSTLSVVTGLDSEKDSCVRTSRQYFKKRPRKLCHKLQHSQTGDHKRSSFDYE